MGEKGGFKDLVAWQKADDLASAIFRECQRLPADGIWLRDQILRSAISVPANIAEGHGRGTQGELLRFIDIARGSLSELEQYLHFLHKEGILASERFEPLNTKRIETAKVLFGLWRSLKALDKGEWDHTGRIREETEHYEPSQ